MKTWSILDIVSLFFSALFGVAVIWGVLTLFAFSLVFILPVLVLLALVWGGYIWWTLRGAQTRVTTIEGESHVIKVTEVNVDPTKHT